jgi:hypothetical protein
MLQANPDKSTAIVIVKFMMPPLAPARAPAGGLMLPMFPI